MKDDPNSPLNLRILILIFTVTFRNLTTDIFLNESFSVHRQSSLRNLFIVKKTSPKTTGPILTELHNALWKDIAYRWHHKRGNINF